MGRFLGAKSQKSDVREVVKFDGSFRQLRRRSDVECAPPQIYPTFIRRT